ncbi:MAG TPA: hypothetical protein VM573_10490 [Actinomycetota bacterium]|jgi:hypothetical protein|nr:hypothetical protein [Actinomycetota bacterium]
MTDKERDDLRSDEETTSGDVLHGGEGDPLGGGIAELEPDERVEEGIPRQPDREDEAAE